MGIVKMNFVNFWNGFNKENNYFINTLRKKYTVEISKNPDYIIYGYPGYDYLDFDGVRIFFTGENIRPDFNLCDYALGFDYMEFGDRYLRFPLYILYEEDLKKALCKHENIKDSISNKTGFCNFVYSNNKADALRENFFNKLCSYKKVDSGGKYLNNIGYKVQNKYDFQKQYKFSIAFENSSTEGYTTEKIVQAFASGTIPIYWGNPNIHKEFNTESFVNCFDYTSFDNVIDRIIQIDKDDGLFIHILQQPILNEPLDIAQYYEKSLLNFFSNIFDQPIEKAFRRNRLFQGQYYEDKQKIIKKISKSYVARYLLKY